MAPLLQLALPLLVAAPALVSDERALNLPIGDPARRDRQLALTVDGISDASRGDLVAPPELAARLEPVKLLFVGESHVDMDFHRVQLRVLQELHKRGRQVLVGLEMYPVGEQAALDRWHSDPALGEEAFLGESHWYRNWGYHWNYYRDIFLFAKAAGIPMFGVNVPRSVVQTVRTKGFAALTPEQKAMLPPRIDTDSAEHRRLVRAFFGGEDSAHADLPEAMFDGMYRAQCTWDAAMGWNALQALRAHGGDQAIMVVLAGSGHVAYGLGAERQARLWFQGRTASLLPVPVVDDDHPEPVSAVQASYADFVWGLPPSAPLPYPTLGLSLAEQKSEDHYKVVVVSPDSPAALAGLRVGDALMAMDGVTLDDKETANRLMSEKRWGDAVSCRVLREGQEQTIVAYLRRQLPKALRAGRTKEPKIAPGSMPPSAIPGKPPSMPVKPPAGGGS
ncbi:MAG TPA: ChaN family lipoprotein [Vicinamibacteria bacterium]|nr:ChaN family lipoprotein [Vicinamibacteria bacterium]